ncbi:hypothetical protein SI65_09741 [Aspergillus cristatus]|uniref:Major facilitator superfamily (MFS) profile domain-containing protein n=1 Tax=Aspergillus cristatus TaxID=573508 RepID=A0A1E3B1E6_ASPCR|nr:hypothetical protein SI65_09741 [Aspergillus cristatus]
MTASLDIEEKGDVTSKEIENAGPDAPFWSPEEKSLVRKIDLVLLPMVWIMYFLSYMDRTNIGNAKISGMDTDLDLTSNQYSIALVIFFIGYVVFEVPSNMLLSRIRPSLFLSGIMTLWGGLTCVMGAVKNFKHLASIRGTSFLNDLTVIGCVEAGFAPGVLVVIASWYKRTEQSKRFGIYISAAILSGAFGGLLAAVIVKGLEGTHGIKGWRWLFIVEGAATIGVALVAAFVPPDFPATSKRFSERQRSVAVARLADDVTAMTQDSEQLSPQRAMVDSVKDWRTWMFVVGYMVIVGSSTLSYFYPTLIEGLSETLPPREQIS